MIRVLVAEDHAIVRAGLCQLFALVDDIEVACEAGTGAEVLDLVRKHPVDLVVLDLNLPGISGTDLLARLVAQREQLPVLVLSMHNEPQIVRRALNAGARGYLTKDCEPELLLASMRKVAGGSRFIDPSLAQRMAFETVAPAADQLHASLTQREFQILRLLVRGVSVNDVAGQLAISNKTVSTHKARLMRKLDVRSNAALVRYGVVHGLLEDA